MQKILYTSPILEYPAAGGPQLRVENSIKALSKISELYVVSRQAEYFIGGKRAINFYKNICQEFFLHHRYQIFVTTNIIERFKEFIEDCFQIHWHKMLSL